MSGSLDQEPISEDLRALLDAEKLCPDPPVDAPQRVFSRLAGALNLSPSMQADSTKRSPDAPIPAPLVSSARVASDATRVISGLGVLRATAIFLAGTAAGAGGYHVVRGARQSETAVVAAPRPIDNTRPAPLFPIPAVPPPAVPSAATPEPPAARLRAASAPPPAAGRDETLAAERGLIEIARTALARGQSESALASLRRHARQFPNGELEEEREGLLVQALVATRDYEAARERAVRFSKRYPRSLFAPVVEQAMKSIP